jgi:hypothetical protein
MADLVVGDPMTATPREISFAFPLSINGKIEAILHRIGSTTVFDRGRYLLRQTATPSLIFWIRY